MYKLGNIAENVVYLSMISGLHSVRVIENLGSLREICSRLNKINELNCDSPETSERVVEEANLLMTATNLAKSMGCKLHCQKDPRGPAIRLIRPDGRSNGMDGETWYL